MGPSEYKQKGMPMVTSRPAHVMAVVLAVMLAACSKAPDPATSFGDTGRDGDGIGPVLAKQAPVVSDVKLVRGMDSFDGPESGKELLKRNGFVVVPRFYHRIFSPYVDDIGPDAKPPLPHYVTADSVHRTFHVILEDEIKKVETAFAADVRSISQQMHRRILADWNSNREQGHAVALSAGYFAVGARLLGGVVTQRRLNADVEQEIKLIEAAKGVAASPLFGYPIDYSRFKPRGFYTETPVLRRYFRAMSWYGLAGFRLVDERETRAAMRIAEVLRTDKDIWERWERIDRAYSFLVSPCDDLTPAEYAEALVSARVMGKGGTELERFREVARGMRDPKINSMVLSPDQMRDWRRLTKGMRFFGKRYLPDSEAFMHLTDPAVPGRLFPTGLEVMAANGSTRAKELVARLPETRSDAWKRGFEKASAVFKEEKGREVPSLYAEILKVAEATTSPPPEKAAAFARTRAYSDKSLVAALAAWASTRHTWLLHGKQSIVAGCIGPDYLLPGYVEPNPAFFAAMRRVIDRTVAILGNVEGADTSRLKKLGELVDRLSAMVRKELAGEQFIDEEKRLLRDYGEVIGRLQGFTFNFPADGRFPWMSLIADVHSETAVARKCLQVGTGGAMPIYVAVEHDGQWQLMIGGVYSY